MTNSNVFKIQLLVFVIVVFIVTFSTVSLMWFEWHGGFPSNFDKWLEFANLWFGFILGPLGGIYLPLYLMGTDAIGEFNLLFPLLGMILSYFPLGLFIKNKRKGPMLLSISAIFWGFVPFIFVGLMSV